MSTLYHIRNKLLPPHPIQTHTHILYLTTLSYTYAGKAAQTQLRHTVVGLHRRHDPIRNSMPIGHRTCGTSLAGLPVLLKKGTVKALRCGFRLGSCLWHRRQWADNSWLYRSITTHWHCTMREDALSSAGHPHRLRVRQ